MQYIKFSSFYLVIVPFCQSCKLDRVVAHLEARQMSIAAFPFKFIRFQNTEQCLIGYKERGIL